MSISIDPISRIEGHLGIELEVTGSNVVAAARCKGTMFRGFELILQNRNPRDAVILTQRICGV
jgi:hydrogenase large subunit